jgi:membrane-bound ClpP family serine protease
MAEILQPPSEYEGIALLLAVSLCFVLALLGIYFLSAERYIVGFASILTAFFFVLIVLGLKGRFRLRVRNV